MAITSYAFTERYVTPSGAGANTGVDWANAYTLAQALANQAVGIRWNFSGTFNPTASMNWSTAGTWAAPVAFRGWDSSQSAVVTDFSDQPIFDGTSVGTNLWFNANHHHYHGLRIRNAGSSGIVGTSTGDYGSYNLMHIHDCSSSGILVDDYNVFSNCWVHDCGALGVSTDTFGAFHGCVFYGNTNGSISGDDGLSVINCYMRGGFRGVQGAGSIGMSVANCTIDNCSTAGIDSAGIESLVYNNIITNCGTGIDISGVSQRFIIIGNNLYGNTNDVVWSQLARGHHSNTFLDPQYVDIANNDYTIQNASLMGLTPNPQMLGTWNVGVYQGGGGGGGGVGAPIFGGTIARD